MNDSVKETILSLLKLDLGITHNLRDAYFSNVIESTCKEIETMGVTLNLESVEDQMLVVEYSAWNYRNRHVNIPLSRSIQFKIHNRLIKKAGKPDAIIEIKLGE
ncbi:hypothetical protein C2I17_21150 [Niallia circulans]|uniref:hypothetical protein n=1 Tax=Niallia circulans TaxID=1397 RepID=UPI00201D9533|nr:hypothetical protein [Niallia circulans]UQZ76848.1 hypothetical protein C2I17_21150 [Niallia circulans]